MAKITAILNTYNEAHLLEDCLKSIVDHVDEIIITDMRSTDGSEKIAQKYGCTVIKIDPKPVVEETIIEKISVAKNEWILALDPDMRIPEETWDEIEEVVSSDKYDVVVFYLRNRIFNKWVQHGHASKCEYHRLFTKKEFFKNGIPSVEIHSLLFSPFLQSRKKYLSRKFAINHLAYDSVSHCLKQHLKYAEYEALQLKSAGVKVSIIKAVYRVLRKFVADFIIRQAWRDGIEGMMYSSIALIMLIQKDMILWQLNRNNED